MEGLAAEDNLRAFEHTGFWQPMDTMRDKQQLEALWTGGKAPWKTW
jgi:glucose-1-phosphate cytidylyltransferase